MYQPFMNNITFINTINTTRKFMSSNPQGVTSHNPTWEIGDIVYSSAPSTILGWVCTTAGTGSSSVWKEIPLN